MKKTKAFYTVVVFALLIILVVMFSGIARAGTIPDGFAGIPWGASRAMVEKVMAERHYTKDPESKAHVYIYNGEFAGYKADLLFTFINNKLYDGGALLFYGETNKYLIKKCFMDLETQLIKKYGEPWNRYRADSKEPWVPWSDSWTLKDSNTTIELKLSKSNTNHNTGWEISSVEGNVVVNYTNTTLQKEEQNRAKDKDL